MDAESWTAHHGKKKCLLLLHARYVVFSNGVSRPVLTEWLDGPNDEPRIREVSVKSTVVCICSHLCIATNIKKNVIPRIHYIRLSIFSEDIDQHFEKIKIKHWGQRYMHKSPVDSCDWVAYLLQRVNARIRESRGALWLGQSSSDGDSSCQGCIALSRQVRSINERTPVDARELSLGAEFICT